MDDHLFLQLGIILLLLVFSAFFSSSETAISSFSRSKTLHMMERYPGSAKYLRYWLNFPGRILTTILIGNNVVNIAATALTTVLAESIFAHRAVAIAIGVMTFVILTFSEVLPKLLAQTYATRMVLIYIRALVFFYYLFLPITIVYDWATRKVFGSANLSHSKKRVTLSDLNFLLNLAKKDGSLQGEKGALLEALTEFNELQIKHVAVPANRVITVPETTSVNELHTIIKEKRFTRYPVTNEKGEHIGMIHAKDLFLQGYLCSLDESIGRYLRPPLWVSSYMKISHVLELMKRNHIQLAFVRDEFGKFDGIVTMEDILEELVGEIADEHDKEEGLPELTKIAPIVLDGETSIHDLNTAYDLGIPEDKDFSTLNGYLLDLFKGEVPKNRSDVFVNGFRFSVLETRGTTITKIALHLN